MDIRPRARIAGTGSFVPEKVLTKFDLENIVDTSDEWITTRTGIRERRVRAEDTATSDLAIEAAKQALAMAETPADEVGAVIVGTITPDTILPACACWVQDRLGARNAAAFDVSAACSGFIYGLSVASGLIATRCVKTALVIGAETLTTITDYTDRSSCILFGDGAGAAVLKEAGDDGRGIWSCSLGADGAGAEMMIMPAGGSRNPPSHETVDQRLHYMKIRGRAVYKFAVMKMVELVEKVVEESDLAIDDLKLIVPHQVNIRILESAANRLGVSMDKIYVNIDRFGNTGGASVAIALDEANRRGMLEPDDIVVLVAFGGGLTWASALIRW
jgi:3-oxoacyl-[acyl-carrier-protein] synthase-3